VTRYFLTHYLDGLRAFSISPPRESDYEECGAFHSRAAQSGLVRVVDDHQSSVRLSTSTRTASSVRVQVKSVSFL